MIMLKRSNDRKVAADKRVKNSFGLPAGQAYSCPGATSVCETVCYAGKIEKQYSAVMGAMLHNYELLKNSSWSGMVELIHGMILEFNGECDRKNVDKVFRIHWDGDFFSRTYASAWATVIGLFPDVQFWVYTRSFTDKLNVIDLIANIPNLAVYLSVDSDNSEWSREIVAEYPSVSIASLSDTMDESALVIQDIRGDNKPGAKCPELIKAIPLQGACPSCSLCVYGKADIRFATTKAGRV